MKEPLSILYHVILTTFFIIEQRASQHKKKAVKGT